MRGLEGAQEDISDEISAAGGDRIEHETLVPRGLVPVRLRGIYCHTLGETWNLNPPNFHHALER